MFTFKVKDKEYKMKFSINAMAENNLMDRVQELLLTMDKGEDLKIVKEFASIIRELIYVGTQKYNPVESIEAAGDLYDDYFDDQKALGKTDITMNFIDMCAKDLQDEGFLGDLLTTAIGNQKVVKKAGKK